MSGIRYKFQDVAENSPQAMKHAKAIVDTLNKDNIPEKQRLHHLEQLSALLEKSNIAHTVSDACFSVYSQALEKEQGADILRYALHQIEKFAKDKPDEYAASARHVMTDFLQNRQPDQLSTLAQEILSAIPFKIITATRKPDQGLHHTAA